MGESKLDVAPTHERQGGLTVTKNFRHCEDLCLP